MKKKPTTAAPGIYGGLGSEDDDEEEEEPPGLVLKEEPKATDGVVGVKPDVDPENLNPKHQRLSRAVRNPRTKTRRGGYLARVNVDLVGPTEASYDGYTGAVISRDRDTGYPAGTPIQDKEPSTVKEFWVSEYPGKSSEGEGAYEVYCDNSGEFKAANSLRW